MSFQYSDEFLERDLVLSEELGLGGTEERMVNCSINLIPHMHGSSIPNSLVCMTRDVIIELSVI
jgi:hypothetical protein